MTVRLTRFLTEAERDMLTEDSIARGYYRDDHRIFQPGWGWFEPWYWDPAKASALGVTRQTPFDQMRAKGYAPHGHGLLSEHYWQNWAAIRPPICVVLPNGEQWEIDRKSSNGTGWDVQGEWPNLTCSPSIAAKGYHGFLQGGAFTADCERAGQPDGVYPYPATWRRLVQFDPQDPRRVYFETHAGDPPADYREPTPPGGLVHSSKPGEG